MRRCARRWRGRSPGQCAARADGDDLAALAGNRESPVAVFQTEVLDVGAAGLGDPQAVQREQRDQRMLCQRPEPAATSSAPSSLRSSAAA